MIARWRCAAGILLLLPSAAMRAEDAKVTTIAGTVTSVEILGAVERTVRSAERDSSFVVVLKVDTIVDGEAPVLPGGEVALAVHSPTRTFGDAGDKVVGQRFRVSFGAGRVEAVLAGVSASSNAAKAVVIVTGKFPGKPESVPGNGVFIEGGAPGARRVLTVAHLVAREGARAKQVQVGVLRDSFKDRTAEPLDRVDAIAKVLRVDEKADLALLEIPLVGDVFEAPVATEDAHTIDYCGISINPYGSRRAFEICPSRKLEPGQSGSPMIVDGKVVRIAQALMPGTCSLHPGVWAGAEKIQGFLRPKNN